MAAVRLVLPILAWAAAAGGTLAAAWAERDDLVPYVFAPTFVVFMLSALWYWLGRPRVSTLVLREDSLTFAAPPRHVFPIQHWILLGRGRDWEDWAEKAEWEAEREALRSRRRTTVPRSDSVHIDDLGRARGIVVESGGRSVRFGSSLGDEDRQWLAGLLRRWAGPQTASAAS